MARKLVSAVVFVFSLTLAMPSGAFWFDSVYCEMDRGRIENNQWPKQYVAQDRLNAHAPFDVMIENGWRQQNLLGRHHFNEDCTKLTEAGKLRVQWILTQPPAQHRQVFIERSLKEEITQARIETTNQFAANIIRDGSQPNIQETHIVSDGRPATTVNFVNTTFRDNMPVPTLPENTYQNGN